MTPLSEVQQSPATPQPAPARSLKVIFAHLGWSEDSIEWHRSAAERAQSWGWHVEPFCVVPDPPGPRLTFRQLDELWRARDKALVRMFHRLREAVQGADVFWNYNGANVHPAWLADFPSLNVYGCFDDPESSEVLSRPVAAYYDACLIGNLASFPAYQSWGVRECEWAPLAFLGPDFDPAMTVERILHEERPVDAVFLGERVLSHRHARLDRLVEAFPSAVFRGKGWPGGYVSNEERRSLYHSAKIGWNLHNSTGPINYRLFALPASGVLQICDNRCRLAQAFRLREEVLGFDTIEECIDLTRYYLAHDQERRELAARGFQRYLQDYREERVWERFFEHFARWHQAKAVGRLQSPKSWPREAVEPPLKRAASRARIQVGKALYRIGLDVRLVQPPAVSSRPVEAAAPEPNVLTAQRTALAWATAALVGEVKAILAVEPQGDAFSKEAAADPVRIVQRISDLAEFDGDSGTKELVVVMADEQSGDKILLLAQRVSWLAPRVLLAFHPPRGESVDGIASMPLNASGLYWVLHPIFEHVIIYGLTDPVVPRAIHSVPPGFQGPLIAECQGAKEPQRP